METNSGVFVSADNTGTNPNLADTDGDEVLGTLAGLNLPALGTNPLRKNILLEYDWFNDNLGSHKCVGHSHRPSSGAVSMVAAAYAAAPVSNPDGTTGITVIQDYGQGGAFTGGNLVNDADPDGNGILNYSIGDRINLNENSLDERAGTCGAGTSPAYDWDGDGIEESSVAKDINCDSGGVCDGVLSTLEDYNDWAHIYFGGLSDLDGAEVPRTIEVVSCDNPAPAPR